VGAGGAGDDEADGPPGLSPKARALLFLRRMCKLYHALPSAVLQEDGGLLMQLLAVEVIVDEAEEEQAHAALGGGEPYDEIGEVLGGDW